MSVRWSSRTPRSRIGIAAATEYESATRIQCARNSPNPAPTRHKRLVSPNNNRARFQVPAPRARRILSSFLRASACAIRNCAAFAQPINKIKPRISSSAAPAVRFFCQVIAKSLSSEVPREPAGAGLFLPAPRIAASSWAAARATLTPGLSRAIISKSPACSALSSMPTQTSFGTPRTRPVNSAGSTPVTTKALLFSKTVLPTIPGSLPNLRRHKRYPSTAAGRPSTSSTDARPTAA